MKTSLAGVRISLGVSLRFFRQKGHCWDTWFTYKSHGPVGEKKETKGVGDGQRLNPMVPFLMGYTKLCVFFCFYFMCFFGLFKPIFWTKSHERKNPYMNVKNRSSIQKNNNSRSTSWKGDHTSKRLSFWNLGRNWSPQGAAGTDSDSIEDNAGEKNLFNNRSQDSHCSPEHSYHQHVCLRLRNMSLPILSHRFFSENFSGCSKNKVLKANSISFVPALPTAYTVAGWFWRFS